MREGRVQKGPSSERDMTRLLFLSLVAALHAAPAAAQAPAPAISLEHRMLLRCSAAFAMVAHGQDRGDAAALAYPVMGKSGREFFVRAGARVMDEAQLTREQIAAALAAEARDLHAKGTIDAVMPVCLPMLVVPDRG